MNKKWVQIAVLVFTCSGMSFVTAGENENSWQALFPDMPSITLAEMEQKKDQIVLVDVRPKFEYDQKHKEGTKHISFSSRMFMLQMEGLIENNKGKTIVVYCESKNCIKSYRAVEKCRKASFNNVVIFDRNEALAKKQDNVVYSQFNETADRVISNN